MHYTSIHHTFSTYCSHFHRLPRYILIQKIGDKCYLISIHLLLNYHAVITKYPFSPLLLPVVLERSGAVEDKMIGGGVLIDNEITLLQELVVVFLGDTVLQHRSMEFAAE